MLTRPDDLSDLDVTEALRAGWDLEPVTVEYAAVGFGSHHWHVADDAGRRWFFSIDDLDTRRRSADDSRDDAYEWLHAALVSASAVRESGASFIVAPVRATDADVVRRIRDRYAAALYPFVDARSRGFDDTFSAAEREEVLRLIAQLHTSSAAAIGIAHVEDFVLSQRDEISRALDETGTRWDTGPYGELARSWFVAQGRRIEQLLREHDRQADRARQQPDRMVLTHGEPHPGNLMQTPDGWMLVDWDTALIAPPERDLWSIAELGAFDAYTNITSSVVSPAMLDLYRLAWELGDVASFAARFRRAHGDTADARAEWANIEHPTP